MLSGVYWYQPVCPYVGPCVRVSVCIQNTGFCQSAVECIKSHLVTSLKIKALKTLMWHLSREPMKEMSSLKK